MANIYETFNFPLNNIRLESPFNKSGVYFIKMTVSNAPIYIQPPECIIKQGFVKSGKKIFCDLVFSIEDNTFLSLLESIEEVAKTQIYENRTKWFETELDEHDIENSLTSAYKMYKSGKLYVIRANIPNTLGKSDLKIYDENETEILYEDLKEDSHVIPILELKGIKCSVRSFQFDFYVRQMLLVSPVQIFEKCIIRKEPVNENAISKISSDETSHTYEMQQPEENSDNSAILAKETTRKLLEETFKGTTPVSFNAPHNYLDIYADENNRPTTNVTTEINNEADREVFASNSQTPKQLANNDICEVELNLDKIDHVETFQLKKRNDIYYKMYKEAKMKANQAKMIALTNYLEAKRIKNTYSLDDSSEDEIDNDLEEAFEEKSKNLSYER